MIARPKTVATISWPTEICASPMSFSAPPKTGFQRGGHLGGPDAFGDHALAESPRYGADRFDKGRRACVLVDGSDERMADRDQVGAKVAELREGCNPVPKSSREILQPRLFGRESL
jgi:hypothetical protein